MGKSWNKWEKNGEKMGNSGKSGVPKSIGTSLYSMSMATLNMKLIGAFLIKL